MLTAYAIYAVCQASVVLYLFRGENAVRQMPLSMWIMLAVFAPLVTVGLIIAALDLLANYIVNLK